MKFTCIGIFNCTGPQRVDNVHKDAVAMKCMSIAHALSLSI